MPSFVPSMLDGAPLSVPGEVASSAGAVAGGALASIEPVPPPFSGALGEEACAGSEGAAATALAGSTAGDATGSEGVCELVPCAPLGPSVLAAPCASSSARSSAGAASAAPLDSLADAISGGAAAVLSLGALDDPTGSADAESRAAGINTTAPTIAHAASRSGAERPRALTRGGIFA